MGYSYVVTSMKSGRDLQKSISDFVDKLDHDSDVLRGYGIDDAAERVEEFRHMLVDVVTVRDELGDR